VVQEVKAEEILSGNKDYEERRKEKYQKEPVLTRNKT
jgi:hypothetical protein